MASKNTADSGHVAVARALDLPVSTKHCIELCRTLRYKNTAAAKQILENVVSLRRPIPFRRFTKDRGHKPGMAAGQYPRNAAKEILKLIHSVEANAQVKGLNASNLKITKILANKASIPVTGGRHRSATKRTHVEVEVCERKVSKVATKVTKQGTEEKPVEKEVKKKDVKQPEPHAHKEVPSERAVPERKENVQKRSAAPMVEPSPAELLQKAQVRAAELNKKEKEQEKTKEVSNLYEELQKKGSLRHREGKV